MVIGAKALIKARRGESILAFILIQSGIPIQKVLFSGICT